MTQHDESFREGARLNIYTGKYIKSANRSREARADRKIRGFSPALARDGRARHLKKGRRVLCQGVWLKYAFIKKHSTDYPVRRLCQTLKVHPSGYYAWLAEPQSARAQEDQRLLGLIKHAWLENGGVYG
ncbi:hypothetical protein ACVWZT_000620 [Pseudomonas sp. TE21394]